MEHLEDSPVSSLQNKVWNRRDPLLAQVSRHLNEGWPDDCSEEALKPYWVWQAELSLQDGCLLWGGHVIIPPPGRESILKELHGGHPGVLHMKTIARMFVWWPKMEADIELPYSTVIIEL